MQLNKKGRFSSAESCVVTVFMYILLVCVGTANEWTVQENVAGPEEPDKWSRSL